MIKAEILSIKTNEGVNFYEFKALGAKNLDKNLRLFMLSLNPSDAKEGDAVELCFKSSDVIIAAAPLKECSAENEIACEIASLNNGEILCELGLKCGFAEFDAVISAASCRRLGLRLNKRVFAYVKAASVYIQN